MAVWRTVPANLVHGPEKAVKVFIPCALVLRPAAAFANAVRYRGPATLVLDTAASIGFDRLGGRAMAHCGAAALRRHLDEHILWPLMRQGMEIVAGLYWDLGDPATGVPKSHRS